MEERFTTKNSSESEHILAFTESTVKAVHSVLYTGVHILGGGEVKRREAGRKPPFDD